MEDYLKPQRLGAGIFTALTGLRLTVRAASGWLSAVRSLVLFAVAGSSLLAFQVVAVGVLDRYGVSPKTAILITTGFYVTAFAIMAIAGGIKRRGFDLPVCKILFIRKKSRV